MTEGWGGDGLQDEPESDPGELRQNDFVPCPFCKQYSHSIGEDQLAAAFMTFQSMWSHRDDGIPTRYCFDERTRDAAQVLMAAARAAPVDTLPKGQDAKQGLAGTEGSAVPEGQAPIPDHSSGTPVE